LNTLGKNESDNECCAYLLFLDKMKKKIILAFIVGISLLSYALVQLVLSGIEFGGIMDKESTVKARASRAFNGTHFQNSPSVIPYDIKVNIVDLLGDQQRVPPGLFPMEVPVVADSVKAGMKATWLGHATVYIEMDGKRILTDPMLSDLVFPIKLIAPKRYNPSPLTVDALPPIDIVTISHDHFDHLDMKTVKVLAASGSQFYVGIGLKAHLIEWGISAAQINEMDWWESLTLDEFTIHCTPARHYSGRTGLNNATLWTSWVISSPNHRIYHSGDSGYGDHFRTIGEKLGPIEIGFIKIGDYGEDLGWRDIHMHTEQSVQAAINLKANIMFPIHWGTFNLSNHDWYEPINLAVQYASEKKVPLVTPKLGETLTFGDPIHNLPWWESMQKLSELREGAPDSSHL
jgi:L-ascorbate metabolism protein UlaG (beta-lactamase superfamily)